MSKELWLEMYEKMEREYPEATDEELIALTEEAAQDHMAAKVDELHDRARYEGPSWVQHDA